MRIYLRNMRKSVMDALFSKTRQGILSACLLHPEKWWYLSDLANQLKVTPSSLQRELASFVEADLFETKKDGNRTYYRVNQACTGVQELQLLFIKTTGISDVAKSALQDFHKDIEFAFIYGSVARAEELGSSDIDIMIIGNVRLADIVVNLRKAEKTLGREINSNLYSQKEFAQKIKNKDAFLKTVFKDEKIFLVGNESEFKALVK